jgi:general secretion pathway protein L
MSTLVVRPQPAARAEPAFDFVWRGNAAPQHGSEQAALLPRAARVVLVWPAEQLTLLALQLPALPPARLQAALAGALEDRLLDDAATQHLAAGPRRADGGIELACACARAPLADCLQRLAQAGHAVAAVVPEPALLAPGEAWLQRGGDALRLLWRDARGEAGWLAQGADAAPLALPRIDCEPGLQEQARACGGAAAEVRKLTTSDFLARAADSDWDLRQFELAPQAAMQRGLRGLGRELRTPAWRRAGWLAALLLLVQFGGIELQALRLGRQRHQLQTQVQDVVSAALPGAPAILDAGVQMRRALDAARLRAGRPATDGIEALMGIAAQVLPDGDAVHSLDFDSGVLHLGLDPAAAGTAALRCDALGLPCAADGAGLSIHGAD